jgi:hypothetical protein
VRNELFACGLVYFYAEARYLCADLINVCAQANVSMRTRKSERNTEINVCGVRKKSAQMRIDFKFSRGIFPHLDSHKSQKIVAARCSEQLD